MALVGVELETLVSESDALTTRPPPCVKFVLTIEVEIYSDSEIRIPAVLPKVFNKQKKRCNSIK